jgi:threonine/homoserine/homoserine lactone efflux protein
MTITPEQLALFAAAMFVMVASPRPFIAAVAARSAALGFHAGAAMAAGASLAEVVWITAAILGLSVIAATHAELLVVLKYVGVAWLLWIGLRLLTARKSLVAPEGAVRREPIWRGVLTGMLLNLGNPKAALFYMALFPGFFDVARLTAWDGFAILAVALPVGLRCDLSYAWAAARARRLLADTHVARRIDRISGGVLCGAGAAIAAS